MEYSQVERHQNLDLTFGGSNPPIPKKGACNSMVEYTLDKRKVNSSNLFRLMIKNKRGYLAQLVEHLTVNQRVNGSNPLLPVFFI